MDWKKIGKKLLFPPIWMMVILVIASAVALVQLRQNPTLLALLNGLANANVFG